MKKYTFKMRKDVLSKPQEIVIIAKNKEIAIQILAGIVNSNKS